MKTIAISQATLPQLSEFAGTKYGMFFDEKMTKDKVRAKLSEVGFMGSTIEIDDDKLEPSGNPPAGEGTDDREYVTVLISLLEGPGGAEPVPVGVNGKVMFIPRGKEARIPIEYYEALQNAQVTSYAETDGKGLGEATSVPIYPVHKIGA